MTTTRREHSEAGYPDLFAVLGRNPKCGCPLAIDLEGSKEAQDEFLNRGLLVELTVPQVAEEEWQRATFPCRHWGVIDGESQRPTNCEQPELVPLRLLGEDGHR